MVSATGHVLAIDQGTTSTKAIVLSDQGEILSVSEGYGIDAIFPQPGWVEYDPQQLFESVCDAARAAVKGAGLGFHESNTEILYPGKNKSNSLLI